MTTPLSEDRMAEALEIAEHFQFSEWSHVSKLSKALLASQAEATRLEDEAKLFRERLGPAGMKVITDLKERAERAEGALVNYKAAAKSWEMRAEKAKAEVVEIENDSMQNVFKIEHLEKQLLSAQADAAALIGLLRESIRHTMTTTHDFDLCKRIQKAVCEPTPSSAIMNFIDRAKKLEPHTCPGYVECPYCQLWQEAKKLAELDGGK